MSGPTDIGIEDMPCDPAQLIRDAASLRAVFGPPHEIAIEKERPALGAHARDFIARSPFLCIGTQGADGAADVSPRGDPPGFVKVIDARHLAIPDRPGNNRLDTLGNIIANPHIGLLFIIPGFDETLRVSGRAALTTDPRLLETMRIADRPPSLAILVRVEAVFMHCAKAFRRARLWSPDAFQDRATMPSLIQMIREDVTGNAVDAAEIPLLDAQLEEEYRESLY